MQTILSRCVLLVALTLSLASHCVSAAEPTDDGNLTVMTLNLRYASTNKPNAWPDRRPVMRDCLRSVVPDLIGTQEGLYPQLKDIASDLPGYAWIGTGRDGGSRGEFMAIFYKSDRFEPMEYDHFWLSDTPNVIASTSWGNRNRRMVTWVRFLDRRAHRQFYFFNTHLDHEIQLAREKGAALIRERIQALKTDLPVILGGDFNAAALTNKAYEILTSDQFLTDTWVSASGSKPKDLATFHNFQGPREGARIDWILTRGPVATERVEIVTFSYRNQYPSDHFPYVAWLRFQ